MADNVDITAGTGTTIATDDCTTGHAQLVKLAYSADGVRTHVTADADGLLVNLGANNDVALAAGTNNIGDVDVLTLPALPAGTNNIGDVDVLTVPAPLSTTGGGTEATALRVTIASDSTGVVSIDDNGASLTVDNGGTFAVQSTLQAGTAYAGKVRLTDGTNDTSVSSTGALFVGGGIAHDVVDSGNPVKVGAKAIAHGANPTAVAAADRTDLYANRHGIQFTIGGHPNIVTSRTTYSAAAQTDVAIGPGTVAPGTKVVVTQVQVTVSNATTATPAVRIGFGATNTPTGAGVVITHPGIPGGGGVSRGDGSGILGIGADGEELRVTSDAATGGVMDVLVSYFTIES